MSSIKIKALSILFGEKATLIGIVVILWMTFSNYLPAKYGFLRNPLHNNMVIIVGTLTIFLAGLLLTARKRKIALVLPNNDEAKATAYDRYN